MCLLLTQTSILTAAPLPRDVASFVERREGCDHFRGEIVESADPARVGELHRELNKLCKGTDNQLLELKKKYATDPAVKAVLAEFEPHIELGPRRLAH